MSGCGRGPMTPRIRRIALYLCWFRMSSSLKLAPAAALSAGLLASLLVWSLSAAAAPQAPRSPVHWVVSWGASPAPPPDAAQARDKGLEFNNQTLREIVHLSIGGSAVRVRVSNVFGRQSLEIGSAHLALRANDSALQPSSDRVLTFGGASAISVPPNAYVLSDPVPLVVPAESDLAISIFLPHAATAAGMHSLAQQTSYVGPGDLTAAPSIANARTISSWIFLAGVDVSAPLSAAAIAVFGDSRVDGHGSTPNANHRLSDLLAKRLSQQGRAFGVLNAGIIGNRILHDAPQIAWELGVNGLARFDRDALNQPGVKYVIVLQGVVDIGLPGTEFAPDSEAVNIDDLTVGMKQLIERAHERGVKIYGATQTPLAGATVIPGIFSAEKEEQRKALNQWIRSSHAFDAVIDFDKVVRDPANPEKLRADFDSGDHIHPNDAGYEAMANAIDLSLFR
jgi:lysophospholipase L1-like esterase